MGMDGLSIANTGVVKEQTSADLAARTEQTMNADMTNSSRQIQSLSNNQRVREKEEDEEAPRREKPNQQDVFEDGLVEDNEEDSKPEYDIEDFNDSNKEFYVKLNIKDDIIELYDSTTDRLVETISGTELGELVQKLNMASGIFINKKV